MQGDTAAAMPGGGGRVHGEEVGKGARQSDEIRRTVPGGVGSSLIFITKTNKWNECRYPPSHELLHVLLFGLFNFTVCFLNTSWRGKYVNFPYY